MFLSFSVPITCSNFIGPPTALPSPSCCRTDTDPRTQCTIWDFNRKLLLHNHLRLPCCGHGHLDIVGYRFRDQPMRVVQLLAKHDSRRGSVVFSKQNIGRAVRRGSLNRCVLNAVDCPKPQTSGGVVDRIAAAVPQRGAYLSTTVLTFSTERPLSPIRTRTVPRSTAFRYELGLRSTHRACRAL